MSCLDVKNNTSVAKAFSVGNNTLCRVVSMLCLLSWLLQLTIP